LGSGQTQLTVNQPLRLRRFESCPLHHIFVAINLRIEYKRERS
jgi:hypothetical protein